MSRLAKLRWIGLALLVVALLVNPGVPYQDPTPEQYARQNREVFWCLCTFTIGVVLFTVGLISHRFRKPMSGGKPSFLDRVYDRHIAE